MPYRLSRSLTENLLGQPEFGMGYQVVAVDSRVFVVINSLVAFESEHLLIDLIDMSDNGKLEVDAILRMWSDDLGWRWRLLDDDDQWWDALQMLAGAEEDIGPALHKFEELDGHKIKVATHGSYRSQTRPGEVFVRYSAFANDRRINGDGSVTAGTYATTENDSSLVPSGLAAVGRYALPNRNPAAFRFMLQPPSGAPIRCGACSPKFGHAGGGVEAFFGNGLPAGTAHGPIRLAER